MGEACTDLAMLLDGYADGELNETDAAKVTRHLADCADCASYVQRVGSLRSQLRGAVSARNLPVGVDTRIRARLRETSPERTLSWLPLPKVAFAALAVAAMTAAGWSLAIRPMRAQIAGVLGLGAGNHIHCTIERTKPPTGGLNRDTEPDFPGLHAAVAESMPKDFTLLESHYCHHEKRQFGHFVFGKDGRKLSVIVSRKASGESFPTATILSTLRAHGIPVYHDVMSHNLRASGLDTGRYFLFVVSELDESANLRVMASVGPVVAETLR